MLTTWFLILFFIHADHLDVNSLLVSFLGLWSLAILCFIRTDHFDVNFLLVSCWPLGCQFSAVFMLITWLSISAYTVACWPLGCQSSAVFMLICWPLGCQFLLVACWPLGCQSSAVFMLITWLSISACSMLTNWMSILCLFHADQLDVKFLLFVLTWMLFLACFFCFLLTTCLSISAYPEDLEAYSLTLQPLVNYVYTPGP